MRTCESCGNIYDKAFIITLSNGDQHVFDSFECAINKIAPHCAHCNSLIIGHGMEAKGTFFCCAHCANAESHFAVDRLSDA